jgi:hypothetical protein
MTNECDIGGMLKTVRQECNRATSKDCIVWPAVDQHSTTAEKAEEYDPRDENNMFCLKSSQNWRLDS